MAKVRPGAVAGLFYPIDPRVLEAAVRDLLEEAHARRRSDLRPRALIAPHAGYVYSGPVAATGYAALDEAARGVRRVALFGPSHRVYFRGLAASSADAFATPLGPVAVDCAAIERLAGLPQVQVLDRAHAEEHSLEVHLPFLRETVGDLTVVPFVVGEASPEAVAEVMEALWDEETLLLVSSDLSHYLDYDTAVEVDRETTRAIEARRDDLRPEQACGCRPLNGLMRLARARGLEVTTLDLRNSGDTAGSRDRVVGYGAYALQ